MLKRIKNKIENTLNEPVDPTGLGVFRIAWSAVLIVEILQLLYFQHLVYDKLPYIQPSEVHWELLLGVWLISAIFLCIGLFYRAASVLNYLFSLVCIGTVTSYEYHMFYAYMGMNFILMFLPAASAISLDSVISKVLAARNKITYSPPTCSLIAYRIPVFVGIALVYFDSIFWKLGSPNWIGGLGAWLPASLPVATTTDTSFLLNHQWLALGLGYTTVVFEALFIVLFWFRKFAWPLIIVGLGLHLGILIEFNIPLFALGVTSIYILLIPPHQWKWLVAFASSKLLNDGATLTVYYDVDCPLCRTTRAIIERCDWFQKVEWKSVQSVSDNCEPKGFEKSKFLKDLHSYNQDGTPYAGFNTYLQIFQRTFITYPIYIFTFLPFVKRIGSLVYAAIARQRNREVCNDLVCGFDPKIQTPYQGSFPLGYSWGVKTKAFVVLYFLCFVCLLQSILISRSASVRYIEKEIGAAGLPIRLVRRVANAVDPISTSFLGVTSHAVFMDSHFDSYNHQIKIVHKQSGQTVPICDENGIPGSYCSGFLWVNWTFRVVGTSVNQERLEKGIRDYTAFWLVKNGFSLDESNSFEILCRKTRVPSEWEEDFYRTEMAKPWFEVGTANWTSKRFECDLVEIESQ